MRSGSAIAQLARKRARNKASLVLFGRAVVATMAVVSSWLGFLTGIRLQNSNYDPYAYARSEERRVGKECRSLCDWSSDVCSSDLVRPRRRCHHGGGLQLARFPHRHTPAKLELRSLRLRQIGRASCRERV